MTRVRWIGLDKEPNMIEQARLEIKASNPNVENIELLAEDINFYAYEPAEFIVSYYTIQFVPPRQRQEIINKIYASLNWGGAFIMFEKVRGCDARFQDMFSSLYADYKLRNGYSPDEIIAKSRSLKGVLEPFSSQGTIDMFKRAGFVDFSTIFKWLCFEGFLCIK